MTPGPPAICTGFVSHHRTSPTEHQFSYPIHQLWFDPDNPEELTQIHKLWSHNRPAPARFRKSDYGIASGGALGSEVRADLQTVLGFKPGGPVRIVTQIRRWGWLFNPITLFLAWDKSETDPVGAVLEVTNTPWKERHRYPIRLIRDGEQFVASFPKQLHVSPFLEEDFVYEFSIQDSEAGCIYEIDVVDSTGNAIVRTAAHMERKKATRASLGRSLMLSPLSTRQVSAGIHSQALRLVRKRVPFVAHPDKRKAS